MVVLAVILITICCILAYCKKKHIDAKMKEIELRNVQDLKTQEVNDKTMAVITKLLNTMYCQVDTIQDDRMDQFMDIINYYNSVINEISVLQTSTLREMQTRCGYIRTDGEETEEDSADGEKGRYMYANIDNDQKL